MLYQPAFFTKHGGIIKGIGRVIEVDQDDFEDTITLYDEDGAGHVFGLWEDVQWMNHPSN